MSTLRVLMPALGQMAEASALRQWLAKGDRVPPDFEHARDAALRESFGLPAGPLPVAALRHFGCTDDPESGARQAVWLCADPVWVRGEATGARLMEWPLTDATRSDSQTLVEALQPCFTEIDATLVMDTPSSWSARLKDGAPASAFVAPVDAMGVSLIDCLPEGDTGRQWRQLFNEAQIVLHAHPANAARVAGGKHPINALWFWGAGSLPDSVQSSLGTVAGTDGVLRGLAKLAGIALAEPSPQFLETTEMDGDALLDLATGNHGDALEDWLPPFQRCLQQRRFDAIVLVFATGERFRLRRAHRLRFWRRA